MRSLFAAVIVGYASAAIQCSFGDYQDALGNFALGFQTDDTDTDTDCYTSTLSLITQLENLVTTFKNFSMDDYLGPLYTAQEALVETTAVFSDCQTTNSAKQLMTRTTSFAGIGDLIGVFAGGYAKYKAKGSSDFWDEFSTVKDAADCAT